MAKVVRKPVDSGPADAYGELLTTRYNPIKPDLLELTAAAFRTHNSVGSADTATWTYGLGRPKGYSWAATMEEEEYERTKPIHNELGQDAISDQHRDALIRKWDEQQADLETLSKRPIAGFIAGLSANIIDPVYIPLYFLPGGLGARLSGTASKARNSIRWGGAFTAEEAAQEAIMQQNMVGRTWQESMAEIGGAALFGGALAGLTVKPAELKAFDEAADALVKNVAERGGIEPLPRTSDDSVGAQSAGLTKDELGVDLFPEQTTGSGKTASGALRNALTPATRLLKSPVRAARAFANNTVRHNYYNNGNLQQKRDATGAPIFDANGKPLYEHKASQAESIDVLSQQERKQLQIKMDQNLTRLWKELSKGMTVGRYRIKGVNSKDLSYREFLGKVGSAMRQGDVSPDQIDEVSEAAQFLRAEIINPIAARFQAAGLLPEGELSVKFAESFYPRVYDTLKIRRSAGAWEEKLTDHFRRAEMKERRAARVKEREEAALDELSDERVANDYENAVIEEELAAMGKLAAPEDAPVPDTSMLQGLEKTLNKATERSERYRGQLAKLDAEIEETAAKVKNNTEWLEKAKRRRKDKWIEKDSFFQGSAAKTSRDKRDAAKMRLASVEKDVAERRKIARRKKATKAQIAAAERGTNVLKQARKSVKTTQSRFEGDRAALVERAKGRMAASVDASTKRLPELKERRQKLAAKLKEEEAKIGPAEKKLADFVEAAGANAVKRAREARGRELKKRVKLRLNDDARARYASKVRGEASAAAREGAEREVAEPDFFDPEDLRDIDDKAYQRMRSATRNILDPEDTGDVAAATTPNMFLERVLQIEDLDLEEFLIDDAEFVLQNFIRRSVSELTWLERSGSKDLSTTTFKDDLASEYDLLRRAATSDKELERLDNLQRRDEADIDALADLLLGRYSAAGDKNAYIANTSRMMRSLTYLAQLGGMTISAAPDLHRPITQYGWGAALRAVGPAMMAWSKAVRLNSAQWRELGIAAESVLNSRAMAIGMMDDTGTSAMSAVSIAARRANATFSTITLMNSWNSMLKMLAGRTAMNAMDSMLTKGYRNLSPKQRENLAQMGIDENTAKRFSEQLDKHGVDLYGSRDFNTRAWDDREAAGLAESIIFREVENTIVTPSFGDRPTVMNSQVGGALLQFKSFFYGSWHQATLRNAQALKRGQLNAVSGMMFAAAMGWMVEIGKLGTSGRMDDLDYYNSRDAIRASVDRSGLLALPMELYNIADSFAAGGISQSLGMDMGGLRYFNRNVWGAALGPAAGYARDALQAAQSGTLGLMREDDQFSRADLRAIRRLAPGQNLFYLRQVVDMLEEMAGDAAGLEPEPRRDRRLNR